MRIHMAGWIYKPFSLLTAAGAVAAAVAILEIPPPARLPTSAVPAGIDKMHMVYEEHETMRVFLAEQDARTRMAAAVESEPEPEPDRPPVVAQAARPSKPVRIVRAPAPKPSSILSPPPGAEPPRVAHGWVQDAARLPRRLWAAVSELMDERPPIPPRPIPPV